MSKSGQAMALAGGKWEKKRTRQAATWDSPQSKRWMLAAGVALGGMPFLAAPVAVSAAVLAWDPAQTPGGTISNPTGSGGSGTWAPDEAVAHWSTGTADTAWSSGTQTSNTAFFGGSAGTVNVAKSGSGVGVQPAGITFASSGYILAAGNGGISPPAPTGSQTTASVTLFIDSGNSGFTSTINAAVISATTVTLGRTEIGGSGKIIFGGTQDNNQTRVIVDNGATLVLNKTGTNINLHALGVAAGDHTPALTVNPGGTAILSGTGGDQIRDRAYIAINGTLDMNGQSEATGPASFDNATLGFTLGSTLGENDVLSISNGGASQFTTNYGAATVSGSNTINISARNGVTSLTPGDYTLIGALSGLGTNNWSLGTSSLMVGANTYDLSLAHSTAGAEILTVSTAVPEPTSLGLMSLAALGLLRRRRKTKMISDH